MTGLLGRPEVRGGVALLLLLLVGGVFTPGTLSALALIAMLPFAAVLGLVAIGQHLVIQQKGFDLSVAGVVSVAAVIVTALPRSSGQGLSAEQCVFIALCLGAAVGTINGLVVTGLRASPIVATIGMNALLLGLAIKLSGGSASSAPAGLVQFATSRIFGLPTIFLLMAVATAAVSFILAQTVIGRRFVAVGTSLPAARILPIRVDLYRTATYAVAGLFFAIAGIMLAGYLTTPVVLSGNPYMLTSVAAFVVGGNTFGGDTRTSVIGTAIGAVFLTYLGQVLVSLSFPQSAQSIIQAVIVFAGVALPEFAQRLRA